MSVQLSEISRDDAPFISTAEAAQFIDLSDRHIRRLALRGAYGIYRRGPAGKHSNAILICVDRMPHEARTRYYQRYPERAPAKSSSTSPASSLTLAAPIRSHATAGEAQQQRAAARFAVIDDYRKGRNGLTDEQWVAKKRLTLPDDFPLSVDSLKKWLRKFAAFGMDGLVDGNGNGRTGRPSVIPAEVREWFVGHYTSGDEPNVAESIFEVRAWATSKGIAIDASDAAFRRAVAKIPDVVLRATREHQDDDSKVLGTIRRDYNFPALQIVQADHHISDLFVRCTDGHVWVKSGDRLVSVGVPGVCEGECKHGHRVWLTVFIDVASRAVLSWVASLAYPSGETIRLGLRILIERFGLPEAVYIDNGKDFVSTFGRAIRRGEAMPMNEPFVASLISALGIRVIYALPYRARSKVIERVFRTWVEQLWKGQPGYVGRLGKRRDRTQRLYNEPAELQSYATFCEMLGVKVDLYNMQPGHRGQGMRGRSPLEVLAATRIPPRRPETEGFAIAFWTWYGRQIRNGGTVDVQSDRYRLPADVYARLPRKSNVQLLVDPADIRTAVVLTGCGHTKSSASRERVFGCGCSGKGSLLCEAALDQLSQYDSGEAITKANYGLLGEYNRELRERVRNNTSPAARQALKEFRRNKLAIFAGMRDRLALDQQPAIQRALGSHVAATAVLLPQSPLSRQVQKLRELTSRDGLTDRQHELADAALAARRLPSSSPARPQLVAAPEPVVDEQRLRSRELRGFCLMSIDCPNARTPGSNYCAPCREELGS